MSLCSAIFHSVLPSYPNPISSKYTPVRLRSGNRRVRKSKRNLCEQIRRAFGNGCFLEINFPFSHTSIPIVAYNGFHMWLNWVPYRGRDFASCGAFLRNTLRKAWHRHFDEEFLGKGAACVDADREDPGSNLLR